MFTLKNGNLVLCGAVALVNPVNTEGVMGAGLALQIKEAYPESYAEYRKACMRGDLAPHKAVLERSLTAGLRAAGAARVAGGTTAREARNGSYSCLGLRLG